MMAKKKDARQLGFDFGKPPRVIRRRPLGGSRATSKAAADSIAPSAGTLRGRIRDWLASRGTTGGTCDEVEVALDMRHQTASARCKELRDAGTILDSGRTRPTRSGRQAVVLVVPA